MKVCTIGHSTRSFEQFWGVLRKHGIQCVVDVRRFPSSRKFPHFNRGELENSLGENGIRYVWMEKLGGRRRGKVAADSPNSGLRSPGFRNYADYMQTEEFQEAIRLLLDIAGACQTAILCAERLFFRCHRMLISDYLTMLGAEVLHIGTGATPVEDEAIPHKYTSGAQVANGRLTYPANIPQVG
ncbi:MAG: DUF488 domain-containing protein [bacterium]|nr:DUF488 domain-containing protein [bacterium]